MTLESRIRDLRARNISKTVAADLVGMGHERFTKVIAALGIEWPNRVKAARVEIDGIMGTYAEHGARLGINPDTLKSRFHRTGGNFVRIRAITDAHVAQFVEMRRDGLSAVAAAERLGFHYNHLHKHAKAKHPEYVAIAKAAKRVRRCWRKSKNQEVAA